MNTSMYICNIYIFIKVLNICLLSITQMDQRERTCVYSYKQQYSYYHCTNDNNNIIIDKYTGDNSHDR